MKDLYIKDEGDFVTVCFQTPNAVTAIMQQPTTVINELYGSDDYKKLDIDVSGVKQIILFSVSHALTIDSEISLNMFS